MMKETTLNEFIDIKKNILENLSKFSAELKTNISEAKDYVKNLFSDIKDECYTDYSERLKHTPIDPEYGHWEGERGESKFIPSPETEKGRAAISKLAEYGMDGIEFKNCEPDYSKCSEGTVRIENMTETRPSNFAQADIKLADQWNKEMREGRNDWKDEDVEKFRKSNNLSWHECCDTKTMNLVSRDIHGADTSVFLHSGGVAECRVRDHVGGEFDE